MPHPLSMQEWTQWCSVIAQQTCPQNLSLCLTSTRTYPSLGLLAFIERLAEFWKKSLGPWDSLPRSPTLHQGYLTPAVLPLIED